MSHPVLDFCPICGRRILDSDEQGCELETGQRCCTYHRDLVTISVEPDREDIPISDRRRDGAYRF